jgi:hypothetical protein
MEIEIVEFVVGDLYYNTLLGYSGLEYRGIHVEHEYMADIV